MQNNFLQAALDYARRGLSVLPCKPNKKPFLSWAEYQKRRATPEEIRELWGKWPNAMIGIVTGEISGILVIDCDTREGYEAIQKLLPDSIILPIARTPRGGWHLWFLYPTGSKITIGAGIMPGVDIRGEGGYVVAPPSVNGDGRGYTWQEGLSLGDVKPAPVPGALLSALSNNINNSLYRCGVVTHNQNDNNGQHLTTNDNIFQEGKRDDNLYHIAQCLANAGDSYEYIKQTLIAIMSSWGERDEKWASAKVESALKRIELKERNLTQEIREWVLTTSGNFLTTDAYIGQHLTTREEKKKCVVILHRLVDEKIIERYGNKNGCFRRIETDIEPVNFLTAPTAEFPIKWPMDIHNHCIIYPGNIVMVAGSKSAGKTGFLLNVVKENMGQHEVVYLNSEMGDTEFRKRLELFGDVPLSDWKFRAYHRASNFADLITQERKIFIVDFLEVTTDFWKVGGMIQEIHKKMKEGICIIALQKAEDKEAGRGGDFSKEKARLYLSLDYLRDQKVNCIKITDAKAWRTDRNPRGMYRNYKLVKGCHFLPVTDWTG